MQLPTIVQSSPLLNLNNADEALGEIVPIYKIDYSQESRGLISSSLGEHKESVNFIWLALSMSRILWPEFDPKEPNPQPLCKSLDSCIPMAGVTMRSGPCSDCQDSQWQNGKPPICAQVFNMLCWDLEDNAPFVFAVKRTGIKALRLLKTLIKRGMSKYVYQSLSVHFAVKIKLTTKPENSYFVQNSESDTKFYAKLANHFIGSLQTVDPQEVNGEAT